MTNEQKDRIRELRALGHGYSAIADALGLTKSQVSSYCRRNSLTGTVSNNDDTNSPIPGYCKNCGKPVTQSPGKKQVLFCSPSCRQKWWNAHLDMVHRRAYYDFRCAGCGKVFTAYGNSHRKYCSHECYIRDRFGGGCHE